MERDKELRLDPTNAVIVKDGKVIGNGIHKRCPHCGKALFPHDTVIIWTVGAVTKWVCCKCRNEYHTLTLTVPVNTAPEKFYEKIRAALFTEEEHG